VDGYHVFAGLAKDAKNEIAKVLPDLNSYFKNAKKSFEDQITLEMAESAKNIVRIWTRDIAFENGSKNRREWVNAHMYGASFLTHLDISWTTFEGRVTVVKR